MFLATEPGSILGGSEFFSNGEFKQIFCGQNEENISHHVQVMYMLTEKSDLTKDVTRSFVFHTISFVLSAQQESCK